MATERKPVSIAEFEREIVDLDGDAAHKKILLFGPSGVGKTVIAGSAPNSLILACEPGYISAARVSLNTLGKQQRKLRKVRDSATAIAAVEYLEDGNAEKYDWVIVDGATTLEHKVRLGYAAEAFDANPTKRAHRNLPDKPDYFNTQNFMLGWVSRLIDLPVNVIITCHDMKVDDEVMPSFQKREGALSNSICGLMHVVGFVRKIEIPRSGEELAKDIYRIYFQRKHDSKNDVTYFAKDQFNALGKWMDNTSIPEIAARIDSSPSNSEDVGEPPEPDVTPARKCAGAPKKPPARKSAGRTTRRS